MPWNSTFPDGNRSVKANKATGQENTTYTEDTMNKDHYWNIGSNEDGRHQFVNMPVQASDPAIATGMDGVSYLKSDGTRIQGFYRNVNGVYQFIPAFLTGTTSLAITGFSTIVAVPPNVYGEIDIWQNTTRKIQKGVFISDATLVEGYSLGENVLDGIFGSFVVFANSGLTNGTPTNLNLRATGGIGIPSTFNYRITYRAI